MGRPQWGVSRICPLLLAPCRLINPVSGNKPRYSVISTPWPAFGIVVLVILGTAIDPALLKSRWHLAVGVTEAVPNIEGGAVAARYGVSATAIHGSRILPGCLILRRKIPVRVAEPVTGTEIEPVPPRRRRRGLSFDASSQDEED